MSHYVDGYVLPLPKNKLDGDAGALTGPSTRRGVS